MHQSPPSVVSPPRWLTEVIAHRGYDEPVQLDEQGEVRCAHGTLARNRGGVLRFVSGESYAANFGREWNWFATTQLDRVGQSDASHQMFFARTGWSPEALRGKRVLDAGCGMGRYAEIASRYAEEVVAVDLSSAVDAAHANIGDRENVAILQADLFNLPFRDASFDLIYSIGVLHHTPDTRAAFLALTRLLRPGGRIAIWVYSGEPATRRAHRTSDLFRLATRRITPERLLRLCRAAAPLGRLYRTRGGRYLYPLLPVSTEARADWRVLDTFDWYSPWYQWKHTWTEVESWFSDAGLLDVRRIEEQPIAVAGTAPESVA